jgi:hypothetical protein
MQPGQPSQSGPFPREPIPPEIVEWARQTFDEEEFLTHVREIEATGGLRLEDFIAELEARARAKSALPRQGQHPIAWSTRNEYGNGCLA